MKNSGDTPKPVVGFHTGRGVELARARVPDEERRRRRVDAAGDAERHPIPPAGLVERPQRRPPAARGRAAAAAQDAVDAYDRNKLLKIPST